jgi:hypothetical protein
VRKRIEEQYGIDALKKMIGPDRDEAWEYGYASGKLAALRWFSAKIGTSSIPEQ